MKKSIFLALVLLAAGLAQAKSPVETYGALAISGNKLVDSAGNPVTLRGMSLFWHMHNGGKEFWRASVVKNLLTDWRASVVRAPVGVETSSSNGFTQEGFIDNPTFALSSVRGIIDAAIEAGIYVVVDYHAHYGNRDRNSAKAFFQTLSEQYGNTPNIIWEIFNEPIDDNWSNIVAYSNEIIPVIRKNSKNVILVPTSFYCQNLTEVDNQLSSKYQNLAYVLHFYAGSHSFRDRLATTMNKGYAVFVSEWGTTDASGNGGYNASNSQSWLDEMDRLGISNCNWSMGNPLKGTTVETSAALEATANQGGPWTDAEITTSGKFVRGYLRGKNPAWTLSDTTTRLLNPLSFSPTKPRLDLDTVVFTGGFNKAVKNWVVKLVGRNSKATYTKNGASTSTVSFKWYAGQRDLGSAKFQAGETIDITLTPLSSKYTLTLDVVTSVGDRTANGLASALWAGTDLRITQPSVAHGSGTLSIRDLSGREVWNTSVSLDGEGAARVATPALRGVHVVSLQVEGKVFQSVLTPAL